MWNMTVNKILIVISVLKKVSRSLEKSLKELKMKGRIEII